MTTVEPIAAGELLDRLAGGLDTTGAFVDEPVVVIAIDGAEPPELARLSALLAPAPVVVIGVADAPGGLEEIGRLEHLAGFDILLAGRDHDIRPWADARLLDPIVDAVRANPSAGVTMAQLLRVGASASAADAIVAESWVYSLLQSGAEHHAWLEARVDSVRRPRPEHPVVILEREGDDLHITLDRPEVRNAYGTRMRDELVEALELVDLDPSIDRAVVRGNGPAFCSGGDLDEFGTAPAPVSAHLVRTSRNAGIVLTRVADRVEFHVHGPCVGAGVELPAFAARVIAAPDATFRLPEIAMGLVPGAGGTSSIPRRIGRHRTAVMALLGTPIDATTALLWGLIDGIDVS